MQAELLPPAVVENWIGALRSCRQEKNRTRAMCLHACLCEHRLDSHPILGNFLVPMLMEFDSLPDALRVFERLSDRNEHSWTSLISGYANCGEPWQALQLYHQMEKEDCVQPTRYTYVALLNACAKLEDAETARGFHSDVIRKALESELYIGGALVDMYVKCSLLEDAQQVFDRLHVRDGVLWNVLIAGYAEHGCGKEVLNLLNKMQLEHVFVDAVTFLGCLKACGIAGALQTGQLVHTETTKKGLETELYVGSSLVDMYAKCEMLAEAYSVFNQLPDRNAVAGAALITGYVDHGFGEEAVNIYNQMQLDGSPVDAITFSGCLKACGSIQALETGQQIHAETIKRGLEKELYVGSTLVDFYVKCGFLFEACYVFHELPVRNTVSWNAMITGFAEIGNSEEVQNSFQQMQLDNTQPDSVTFVCSLKACRARGALGTGRGLHAEITKRGLEGQLSVANTLLGLYIHHGLVAEASSVFNWLREADAVSYNTLIAGYIEHDLDSDALHYFQKVHLHCMPLDPGTYALALKACGMTGALEMGQNVHSEVTRKGMERDLQVGSSLVDMYSKCGSLAEAHRVFCRFPTRDTITWNALISRYAELGLGEEALNCFQQMQLESVSADTVTFVSALKACGTLGALKRAQEICAETIKIGMESEPFLISTVVDIYSKYGLLVEARRLIEHFSIQDAVSWNDLIAGYADEHRLDDDVLSCSRQMNLEGVSADIITLLCGLKASGTVRGSESCKPLHAEIIKRGFDTDVYVGSALVDKYAKLDLLAEARQVFDSLPTKNVVVWNTLISGYSEHGLSEEALNCFKQMQVKGVSADEVTFILCLKACGTIGALEAGRELYIEIIEVGFTMDISVGNVLIDMYGKCGLVAEGRDVFDKLLDRDLVSWNTMIKAYGENHQGDMAVKCFDEMQEQGVKPNSVTFICLLAACSHASLVIEGQEYFKVMREHGIHPNFYHFACVVDLLARSGQVTEAERYLAAMQCPPSSGILLDVLTSCKIYGEVEAGHRCFQQLVEMHQEDAAAYMLMADIYASASRWIDAKRVETMRRYCGTVKKTGKALVEVNKVMYEFVVGLEQNKEMLESSTVLCMGTVDEGYVPHLDLVSEVVSNAQCGETFFEFEGSFSFFKWT